MWFLHVCAMAMNKLNKSNAPAFLVVVVATMHMDSSRSLREVCQRTKCKTPIIGCNMAKPPGKNDEQNLLWDTLEATMMEDIHLLRPNLLSQQNKVDIRKHTQTAYGVGAVVFFQKLRLFGFHACGSVSDNSRRCPEVG